MYTSASYSINPRVPMHAPAWFDLDDEALPRRVVRAVVRRDDEATIQITPHTSWASASGAPAMQFPILRRNSRRRNNGMAARIEPFFNFDAQHSQEN
jgi:hypothetical protein